MPRQLCKASRCLSLILMMGYPWLSLHVHDPLYLHVTELGVLYDLF